MVTTDKRHGTAYNFLFVDELIVANMMTYFSILDFKRFIAIEMTFKVPKGHR